MHDLKLHIGDRVAVGSTTGHTATVVGTALLPASSHTDYDQSAWMTAAGLEAAVGPVGQARPERLRGLRLREVGEGRQRDRGGAPAWRAGDPDSDDLRVGAGDAADRGHEPRASSRSLPLALGVFFALLATATVAHALVTTVRRRRQELAVLRSLGFTRRQTRVAIAWQATLIAAGRA